MLPVVGIFYSNTNDGKGWQHLPAISNYFNEKNWLPLVGDRIGMRASDQALLALPSHQGVLTVKERIFNHSLCEVAIVCHYEAF